LGDGGALREALEHFLAEWPLQLGRCAVRSLEAVAFGQLPPIRGTVLDLGCGDGAFGRRVTEADILYGVDTDTGRLAAAVARGVRVVAAEAGRLPLRADSVDAVIANSTLEHLADPGAAVGAAARVLRTGGRFVCTVPLAGLLDNLYFAAGPDGAAYRRDFTEYWQHRTMAPVDEWLDLFARHAPALSLTRQLPLESARQTAVVDLLWSVRVAPVPPFEARSDRIGAQRRGLAWLLAELLGESTGSGAASSVLFDFVKRAS
jgi:SAM-dependent methyltransferase